MPEKIYKDAVTGEIVSPEYAMENQSTTVLQQTMSDKNIASFIVALVGVLPNILIASDLLEVVSQSDAEWTGKPQLIRALKRRIEEAD